MGVYRNSLICRSSPLLNNSEMPGPRHIYSSFIAWEGRAMRSPFGLNYSLPFGESHPSEVSFKRYELQVANQQSMV
jgi:hypothetical protein